MTTNSRFIRNTITTLLFGMVIFSSTFCHFSGKSKPAFKQILDTAHYYLNINDTVKYVGMNTCMQCHASIYNSFIHTGMGESFGIATKQKSSAKFGPHIVVYDSAKDFYYHPFWKKDSLYVLEFRLQGKDTIYKQEHHINYIIGSGEHTNSHLYSINGYLFQAPITFYTQEGKWDLAPGFSDGFNSRFNREVGLECMSCHNSYPEFVKGSTNKYISVPNGIACERCHGPGELHVLAIQMGHIVDTAKKIDYTIVNPAKLPVELQTNICERCHLQGNTVLKPGKSFYDFKPGMMLSDIMDVFLPKYAGMENEYMMASHIARLKMSKCYISNRLTCLTCHNPHVDVRSVSDNSFNAVCKNCHSEKSNNFCKEVLQQPTDTDCIGCHMPKGNTIDIPHVITTDHYIRIPATQPPPGGTAKVRKFITLYDVNNPNPSPETRGKAFIQQFERFQSDYPMLLDSAKNYFPDATTAEIKKNFSSLVYISYLKNDYDRILYYINALQMKYITDTLLIHTDYSNSDAITAYQVGEAYKENSDFRSALAFYQKACELAPYELEYRNKLGVVQLLLNERDDAEKTFDFILSQNPQFVSAITNKGYIALLRGNITLAKEFCAQALALDPDNKQALLNTAQCYISEKNYKEAEKRLKMVLLKYPEDLMVKQALERLKAME